MDRRRIALLVILSALAACGKKEPATPSSSASKLAALPPAPALLTIEEAKRRMPADFMKKIFQELPLKDQAQILKDDVRQPYEDWRQMRDHAELVLPAPAGFQPAATGRKIKLTLIPRKTQLRRGEAFWYRLELQNVGSEEIEFSDDDSLFKYGNGIFLSWPFFVTEPDGSVKKMISDPDEVCSDMGTEFRLPGWEHMTDKQKQEAVDAVEEEDKRNDDQYLKLHVKLKPGETLFTRPWRHAVDPCFTIIPKGKEANPFDVQGDFRQLATEYKFNKLGTHRIKVVYEDMPIRDDEEMIQSLIKSGIPRERQKKYQDERERDALGRVESNSAVFEVTRW